MINNNNNNTTIPDAKSLVEEIINYEKLQGQNSLDNFFTTTEEQWEKTKTTYLKIENYIRKNSHKIPTWKAAGSLHYGMSISEIESMVREKLQELVVSNQLIMENSPGNEHSTFFCENKRGKNDLTRIWGANFLNANLDSNSTLQAAIHYLVIDEGAEEIEVEVHYKGEFPIISSVKNAHVLSKRIIGEKKARDYRFCNELQKVRYCDFQDPGNIIRDSNNIGWIVDTEIKSFFPPKYSNGYFHILRYLKKRFKVLSSSENTTSTTFTIPISDIIPDVVQN